LLQENVGFCTNHVQKRLGTAFAINLDTESRSQKMSSAELISALSARKAAIQDAWFAAARPNMPADEANMWREAYGLACRRYYRAFFAFR
jgi:hypothetical protein